ncbi:MAG: precorrin-6B C5,15-methyltransferase / cobalt-precorrin-6B C5,C15-methyltransferase [Thermoleophilaceae bacterium]|nr:precorrin-6B C5,15-methyltransferase / cobalt-precorrin-6B C5,C15-methyltransferase [Thermoleophilaceae bacterium]
MTPDRPLAVVGIGADGWAGLGEPARAALRSAELIVGSKRQLALLEETEAERRAWPSPIDPLVDELVDGQARSTAVLASGDPMLHGIGATLARRLEPGRLRVYPHPSAFALACARLGWPATEVSLVSAVRQPAEVAGRLLQPGRRVVAYVAGAGGAAAVARVASERGFGGSRMVVLEQLGGADERIHETTPDAWGERGADPLHAVALDCGDAPDAPLLPITPGLPDDAYESDGQLTKRGVRAIALAALAPAPRQLLWDVGAGSGSIGIEWLRAEETARAIAIEARADRAERVAANALRLGVPRLEVVQGQAPEALDGLDAPDAVFVGGGVTAPDLLERCWSALRPGGRIVANAVTLEGEARLLEARAAHGGQLMRIGLEHADPVGRFTAWRAQLPVVQWSARRGSS